MSGLRAAAIGMFITAASWCAATPAYAMGAPATVQVFIAVCDADHMVPSLLDTAERVAYDAYLEIGVAIEWMNACGIDGQLLFNPGSATERRMQPHHTIGLLDVRKGRVAAHRIVVVGQEASDQSDCGAITIAVATAPLHWQRERQPFGEARDWLRRSVADSQQATDRLAFSERMAKKGYYSKSQVDADRSRLQSSQFAVSKVVMEKNVLENFTKKSQQAKLESTGEVPPQAAVKVKRLAPPISLLRDDGRPSGRI